MSNKRCTINSQMRHETFQWSLWGVVYIWTSSKACCTRTVTGIWYLPSKLSIDTLLVFEGFVFIEQLFQVKPSTLTCWPSCSMSTVFGTIEYKKICKLAARSGQGLVMLQSVSRLTYVIWVLITFSCSVKSKGLSSFM